MKAILAINRLNDVLFIDSDREFAEHINNQARLSGLIQDDFEDSSGTLIIDTNMVMQLFSPLFMSQWFLIDHKRNPCSSITCENGFLFVFKQHEELLFMAVNGDGNEGEERLHRKLAVFIRLTEFLFGPVTEEIGYSRFVDRKERWTFLRGILSTWSQLINDEQSFLVEAIERLHANFAVNSKCMELLENAVNKIMKAGEKFTHHALIVVNSKLLSLYSDRSATELVSADIMSIILLVKKVFPTQEKLEDFFAFTYRNPKDMRKTPASMSVYATTDRYESAVEGEEDSGDEDHYQSARDTPPKSKAAKDSSRESPYPQVSEHTKDVYLSPVEDNGNEEETETQNIIPEERRERVFRRPHTSTSDDLAIIENPPSSLRGRARSRSVNDVVSPGGLNSFSSEQTSTSGSMKSIPNESSPLLTSDVINKMDDNLDYYCQNCFLCTDVCYFSPHQLHMLKIFPGIVLVLVSQVPFGNYANILCQLFTLFKDLQVGKKARVQKSQGQELYDIINSLINKLLVVPKKIKGNAQVLSIFNDIKSKWEKAGFRNSFLSYLEQSSNEIPPKVERSLNVLLKKVKDLFLYLYIIPRTPSAAVSMAIQSVVKKSQMTLQDFKDYLSVKAQRNFTMTTYLGTFPGLIHFIYIDRRTNYMTAPSLNITQKDDDRTQHDATQLLKDKIWAMAQWIQLKLKKGIFTMAVREGDFHYSYFLWFEDTSGMRIPLHHYSKPYGIQSPPGILSGSFYQNLSQTLFPNVVPGAVGCYELMMMHVGLVHTSYVMEHSRHLVRHIVENSGDAFAPMGLLR